MGRRIRIGLLAAAAALVLALVGAGTWVWTQTSAYDASIDRVYDVPVPAITASPDPEVIARGEHLAHAVAACATRDCHGVDLGGGKPIDATPVAVFTGPNISAGGLGIAYSDGEFARLIRHGIKKDGRTVRFMPVQDFNWLPDSDVVAIISYLRSLPAVSRENGTTDIKVLGKILDRRDQFTIDVARRIDHTKHENVPPPAPNAEYGAFLARACTGCHGEHLSGGRIPGSPSQIPTPLNLTPDDTGLKSWTYADFDVLLRTAKRKNGATLDPFMPIAAFAALDDTEKHALWAYLRVIPPLALGNR
jgi:hypothetical protein